MIKKAFLVLLAAACIVLCLTSCGATLNAEGKYDSILLFDKMCQKTLNQQNMIINIYDTKMKTNLVGTEYIVGTTDWCYLKSSEVDVYTFVKDGTYYLAYIPRLEGGHSFYLTEKEYYNLYYKSYYSSLIDAIDDIPYLYGEFTCKIESKSALDMTVVLTGTNTSTGEKKTVTAKIEKGLMTEVELCVESNSQTTYTVMEITYNNATIELPDLSDLHNHSEESDH